MKHVFINPKFSLATGILLLFAFGTMAQTPISIPTKLKTVVKTTTLPIGLMLPPVDSLKKRVDPAAQAINFIIGKKVNTVVKITVEGVVKNIGADDYISGANQQLILLYRKNPGGSPELIATKAFQNLAKGAEVKISWATDWSRANEFPPQFILVISYDPDIYADGNYSNNDNNVINNQITREGTDINKMKW